MMQGWQTCGNDKCLDRNYFPVRWAARKTPSKSVNRTSHCVCHLVELFSLTLTICSSFPNNSLTHGFQPTDNCCHRICNKGYKVSKKKEEKIPTTRWMSLCIYHRLFVMIISLIQISEMHSKVMSQVCGANEVGCLLDEDCSSGLFCNTGLAQPRCSRNLLMVVDFKHFVPVSWRRLTLFIFAKQITKFWVNALFAKVHKCSFTAVRALVWNNGTLLCKIDFNRNLSF